MSASRNARIDAANALSTLDAIRTFAMLIPVDTLDAALVERASGPGTAPTAFRIWKAGENDSDEGPTYFTAESAAKLMAEQEARGRELSIDFDHLSLKSDRPAESGRASGWHRLAVRPDASGKPELWAVDVKWCVDAKAGLEEQPPRWKFFSPAFRTTAEGEVVSYVNLALCINPLTHQLPSLASATAATKETTMSMKAALMAALAAMTKADATDEDKQASAKTLGEYLEGMKDDDKKEEKADGDKPKECADGAPPPPPPPPAKDEKKDDKKPEEKTEAKAMAADVLALTNRLNAQEIASLLAARPEVPDSVKRWCATQSVDVVRGFLGANPKPTAPRNERAAQGDASGTQRLQLHGAAKNELDEAMGIRTHASNPYETKDDGTFVLQTVKPSDFRAANAAKKGA